VKTSNLLFRSIWIVHGRNLLSRIEKKKSGKSILRCFVVSFKTPLTQPRTATTVFVRHEALLHNPHHTSAYSIMTSHSHNTAMTPEDSVVMNSNARKWLKENFNSDNTQR
jgi:hypothetical protein